MTVLGDPYVVVLGEFDDTDLHHLVECLAGRGVQTKWFELGRPAEEYDVTWALADLPVLQSRDLVIDATCLDGAIAVVFKLARMYERNLTTLDLGTAADNAFGAREWNATLLNGIQRLIDVTKTRTYGSPRELTWHDWKPLLLARASRYGFRVPATVLTTQLTGRITERIVGKSINANRFIDRERAFPTAEIDAAVIGALKEHRTPVPSLLQALIVRKHELRLVVFGRHVVRAVVAPTDESIDIRYSERVVLLGLDVVDDGEHPALKLATEHGLSYCCLDMIADENDDEWLVDVTPRGSWYWTEDPQAMNLTHEIVRLIVMEDA